MFDKFELFGELVRGDAGDQEVAEVFLDLTISSLEDWSLVCHLMEMFRPNVWQELEQRYAR